MGRDLQKKKRRSSRQAIRQPSSTKPKRQLNPLGNSLIAQNWDKRETMAQNYRRLGLVARLRAPTGGTEPRQQQAVGSGSNKTRFSTKASDPFGIRPVTANVVSEARVERDEVGNIVRVIRAGKRDNPLNDPLNELDSDSEGDDMDDGQEFEGLDNDSTTDVMKALEAEANRPLVKKIRRQSEREREWLGKLLRKYGDDTLAMARDRKLNPMQQTQADIMRRLKKFRGDA